jgi:hypothetical protein
VGTAEGSVGPIAYTYESTDPTYKDPSLPIAGDACTSPPVVCFHISVPSLLTQYTLSSYDPKYRRPSLSNAGDDFISVSVLNAHFFFPAVVNAYM